MPAEPDASSSCSRSHGSACANDTLASTSATSPADPQMENTPVDQPKVAPTNIVAVGAAGEAIIVEVVGVVVVVAAAAAAVVVVVVVVAGLV